MRSTVFSTALLSFLGSLQGVLARPASFASPTNTTFQANSTASITTASNSTLEEPGLEKLGSHYGWAGFFESSECQGPPVGDRPKFDDQACRPVTPAADYLGISWGSWPLGLSSLQLYRDSACKVPAETIDRADNTIGPGDCMGMDQVGQIGSMKSNG